MVRAMGSLFSPIAALAINMAVQIVGFRLRRGSHFFRSVMEGFFLGALALLIIESLLIIGDETRSDGVTMALLVNLPTYLALSYCYYSFVQLGQTSIRLRMYSEIASRAAGVTIAEMEREYDESALTDMRVQRLIESGDILEKEGRYFIGRRRLLLVVHIIFAAKHILLGKKSEVE
jgi:hypothetical protein